MPPAEHTHTRGQCAAHGVCLGLLGGWCTVALQAAEGSGGGAQKSCTILLCEVPLQPPAAICRGADAHVTVGAVQKAARGRQRRRRVAEVPDLPLCRAIVEAALAALRVTGCSAADPCHGGVACRIDGPATAPRGAAGVHVLPPNRLLVPGEAVLRPAGGGVRYIAARRPSVLSRAVPLPVVLPTCSVAEPTALCEHTSVAIFDHAVIREEEA